MAALVFGLRGLGATGHVGADLVDELGAAADLTGLLDQDLAGVEGDGLDGTVLEVDEARRDEHEDEDQGDHDVVGEAAARVGPPEVAVEDVTHWV